MFQLTLEYFCNKSVEFATNTNQWMLLIFLKYWFFFILWNIVSKYNKREAYICDVRSQKNVKICSFVGILEI